MQTIVENAIPKVKAKQVEDAEKNDINPFFIVSPDLEGVDRDD